MSDKFYIKVRLHGKENDLLSYIDGMEHICDIRSQSGFYRDRGNTQLGRIYIEVEY